jgi:hypothetical protein
MISLPDGPKVADGHLRAGGREHRLERSKT